MQALFNILFIMMVLVFLIGMIRPEVFTNKKTGEVPDRKLIAMGSVPVMLISLVMVAVLAEEPASSAVVETSTSSAAVEESSELIIDPDATVMTFPVKEAQQDPQRESLGMTAEKFMVVFNGTSSASNAAYRIDSIDLNPGEVKDTFKVMLSERQALIGTVSKDNGMLESVTSISAGDGTMASGADMIILAGVLVRSISPDIGKKGANDLVTGMMNEIVGAKGKTTSWEVGEVEYFGMYSNQIGFWFGAEGIEITE